MDCKIINLNSMAEKKFFKSVAFHSKNNDSIYKIRPDHY